MRKITFFDTEVSKSTKQILDYGAAGSDGALLHTQSAADFMGFIQESAFLCGHNVFRFDLKYLKEQTEKELSPDAAGSRNVIDTLYWSALLFPEHPYHHLVKDDKLESQERNNPLNDAKKAQELFYDELEAFRRLPEPLKEIFYSLLAPREEFGAFFRFLEYSEMDFELETLIKSFFDGKVCSNAPFAELSAQTPVELAYSLALIRAENACSVTPPWIMKNYPKLPAVMRLLRGTPCSGGCAYCREKQDADGGLKEFFGHDKYRDFDGIPLQKQAVQAALEGESLLAVFPTGGGKSITFQVPALMAGRNERGLTVIISPLQSLMQDQVYNLERIGITDAVTINGLLDPIERAEAIRRLEEGEAKLLYIAPESLRSRTIERLLLGRNVVRFVVDEAHCFSAWGQDFRVDYLYIGEFIRTLCEKKKLPKSIPVSCFTATAKQNVIADIRAYFRKELGLELELFTASASRKNLTYQVLPVQDGQKYACIRRLLDSRKCPTIIYASRTKRTEELAARLNEDGYFARAYHGQMEKKEKSENQRAFVEGNVDIMVATSAFGMGVDKKDVGMVIHYDISDSLENYVQEAGRAGRDPAILADCYVLYDEVDLNKHFMLLNQTKISIQEIQQIWRAIKEMTRRRAKFSSSALELARAAGWDETVREVETRVRTAINALEEANYIKRGENIPHVYADKVTTDYQEALQFVEDYFQMEYTAFLRKYFRGERGEEIRRNITQKKFEQLFGALSPAQLQIIKDKEEACIVVAAGPGSGKTKILVHKLASLLLLEDVKHEQLLMLTFSRAAAMEFRQRLYALIENSAAYVEIKTFHSYCFDLLGRVGSLQCSENVVRDAVKGIEEGEVEASRITKTVLVIDEAQDMEEQEYRLVQALLDKNDDIRVIAVGDDDQNIYEFRGASSAYMDNLRKREGARLYELVENFRSLSNLVAYTNHFATCISERMKTNPIVPVQKECGRITVVEYRYPNLVFPVVQKMMEDGISKNTCVLTWKNDTALQVTGLFCKQGGRARLVQEKEDFPLKNLREVRYFCALLQIGGGDYIIDENRWDTAKRELRNIFGKSIQYEPCSNMIEIFEKSNPRMKYVSDWKLYLEESHIGDFYRQDREEEICVSTMHKAKGHEYEHEVLLLDDFKVSSEADKRLLYVAMTRAKKTLAIHYAGSYLRRCGRYADGAVPYLNYEYDEARYPASGLLMFQTGMKDVYLSYFYKSRNLVKKLCSGDEVRADESGCLDARGNRLMLYSKSFKEKLQKYFAGGYRIARARISFMYHWHEEGREDEALVMLPQLELVNKAVQTGNAACTVE